MYKIGNTNYNSTELDSKKSISEINKIREDLGEQLSYMDELISKINSKVGEIYYNPAPSAEDAKSPSVKTERQDDLVTDLKGRVETIRRFNARLNNIHINLVEAI